MDFLFLFFFWCMNCLPYTLFKHQNNIPAIIIFNTLVKAFLADPGLLVTCATLHDAFHKLTVLIRSLALTHPQHFSSILGHAFIKPLSFPLTAIAAALLCRTCLENRSEVSVAYWITHTYTYSVHAGSSAMINCKKEAMAEFRECWNFSILDLLPWLSLRWVYCSEKTVTIVF